VAQSRASTWHRLIGSLVCFIKVWFEVAGGRTRDLRAGERTKRVGLTVYPVGDSYDTIGAICISTASWFGSDHDRVGA
jgi:hypothetical protein